MTPGSRTPGLILSGGGARGAYQVGVLAGIHEILGDGPLPFAVVSGTSAGAINAAGMVSRAASFGEAVAVLAQLWSNLRIEHVYSTSSRRLAALGARWFRTLFLSGPERNGAPPLSFLDNSPLRRLLARSLDVEAIDQAITAGHVRALAINATGYGTGLATSFVHGAEDIRPWSRTRRRGVRAKIGIEHLMASTAIPFVFPAVRLGNDYYGDGSLRQTAPLSPAVHCGARRILAIAAGQLLAEATGAGPLDSHPSLAQIAAHALASVFLDNVGADVERAQRLNRLAASLPESAPSRHDHLDHLDMLVLTPSRNIAELAADHVQLLPPALRLLLSGVGGTAYSGGGVLSYLLFDGRFCADLISLGREDALARHEEITAFLSGAEATWLPVMFPDTV